MDQQELDHDNDSYSVPTGDHDNNAYSVPTGNHDNDSYSVPTGDHDNDSYSMPTGCWSKGDGAARNAEPIKMIQVGRNVECITDTQTERSSAPVEIIQHHVRGTMNASQARPLPAIAYTLARRASCTPTVLIASPPFGARITIWLGLELGSG